MAHLGGIISRGPGLAFVEATSVTANGRITPQDSGIWKDSQIEPLARVVEFAHSQGQKIGIQLAHAGRKASTVAPWISGADASSKNVGGWPDDVWAPSAEAYSERLPEPHAFSLAEIETFKEAWAAGVKRALKAGFDVIEIHNAHGYLLSEFLSPAANKRTDKYGGSFENRIRLTLEVVELTRSLIPDTMPLFIRISATDWLEEQKDMESWKIEDSCELAKRLVGKVDLIDVSSGGVSPKQNIHAAGPVNFSAGGKAYQAVSTGPPAYFPPTLLLISSFTNRPPASIPQDQRSRRRRPPHRDGRRYQRRLSSAGGCGEGPRCRLRRACVPEEPRAGIPVRRRAGHRCAHAEPDRLGLQGPW